MFQKIPLKKYIAIAFWVAIVSVSMYMYFFKTDFLKSYLFSLSGTSLVLVYIAYLLAGSLRGLTLIPVTYLIIAGVLLLPPVPLYILTMIGVIVSSVSIYYFSEYLDLDRYFESKHQKYIDSLKRFLSKNELPIVVAWSFTPFLPTDLICYVCGTLEVDIKKFVLGIVVGEGIACALYIFLGKEIILKLLF